MSDLLAVALDYAARGLPVFPCTPRGKTPAVGRGFHAATTNPATIRRYWTDPDRNIAIPTGMPSGVWVLDIDGPEGEASLRALETKHGAIPKTRTVVTSRGKHAWFAYPGAIPTTVGRIGLASIPAATTATSSCRPLSIKQAIATPSSAIHGHRLNPHRHG